MRRLQGGPAALGENDAALHPVPIPRVLKLGAYGFLLTSSHWARGAGIWEGSTPGGIPSGMWIGLLLAGGTVSAWDAWRWRRTARREMARLEAMQSRLQCREQELAGIRDQLTEARRMNTLGLLSASLAHDINNHLSAVRMSNQLVARLSGEAPEIQRRVRNIEGSIQHLRDLVESLFGADRREGQELRQVEVASEVTSLIPLLQDEFLPKVRVDLSLPPGPRIAAVTRTAFRRILMNLIVNAAEAMDRQGVLRIRIAGTDLVSFEAMVLYPAGADRWISLTVEDTGPGIGSEALDRLFDPTYSTKKRDNRLGSGLGLYIVHTLSVEEGIGLAIRSDPGQGTCFELVLPELEQEHDQTRIGCA